jgi:hypothetical protein
MWPEDVGEMFGESPGDGEAFDGESYDLESLEGEATRGRRLREQRRRRMQALENQRRLQAARASSTGQVVPAGRGGAPTARATAAAIRQVDLQSKVQADVMGSALRVRDRQVDSLYTTQLAQALSTQVKDSFGDVFDNPFARAAATAFPLVPLGLMPRSRETGLAGRGMYTFGTAAVLFGLTFVGHLRSRGRVPNRISITAPAQIKTGQPQAFLADVLDDRGGVIPGKSVVWASSDPSVASVDANGLVTPLKVGATAISASVKEGPVARVMLAVVA